MYSTNPQVSITLDRYGDINSLQQAIRSLFRLGGASNLADALQLLRSRVFASDAVRPGARLVALIVTEEPWCDSQIISDAYYLKNNMNVSIIGLVLTHYQGVDPGCWGRVVSSNQYIEVPNYNQIFRYISEVTQYVCGNVASSPSKYVAREIYFKPKMLLL